MRLSTVGLAIAAVAVLSAGCSAPAPAVVPSTPQPSSAAATPSRNPSGPARVDFGARHRWPDGFAVTVAAPEVFTPSTWVRTVNRFDRYLSVKVTVHNGTGRAVELSGFEASGRAAGKAADPTVDPGKLGPGPPSKLTKGATTVFHLGFGVAKRKGFTLQVTPAPGMDPAFFTG